MAAAREAAQQLSGTGEVAMPRLSGDLAGLGAVPAQGGDLPNGLAGLATKESGS